MKSAGKILVLIGFVMMVLVVICAGPCAAADEGKQVIKITAKKFEYAPNIITLKKGVPVVLEFTSLDRLHGFTCPSLGIRSDVYPGKVTKVEFVPEKAGEFPFHCDNFCGTGHDKMTGKIVVEE